MHWTDLPPCNYLTHLFETLTLHYIQYEEISTRLEGHHISIYLAATAPNIIFI